MPCDGANGKPKAYKTAVGGAINIYTMALRGNGIGFRAFFCSGEGRTEVNMLQLEEDKTMQGAALKKALAPHRLRSFRTARWFCHLSTEPFLEVSVYAVNEETRRIVKQHVHDLYFNLSRNRGLHTREDICFFKEDRLFFGTVSHEGICMAQPVTQEFLGLLQNFGMWSNNEDGFARIDLADF